MTVKQVWDFGKLHGAQSFSPIVSDVDELENTGNILFSSGAIPGGPNNSVLGRIQEVDKVPGQSPESTPGGGD